MLLWDGDLLNFHFGDSNHSLQSWGMSFGRSVGVASGAHSATPDLFASEGLDGHWTLDSLMPVLSAERLIDIDSPSASLASEGLTGTETAASARHGEFSSGFILPSVLKVEEPFAMPLSVDTVAGLGSDSFIDMTADLQSSDLIAAKPAWTVAMRMAWRH